MIVKECKVGNTTIRCDNSCVRSPDEVEQIHKNLGAMVTRQYTRKLEKEAKEETA
ncbi:MAG: hypothetical protein IJ468_14770 [Lachnospiraceae bacterium]|nr:hypothetical protein [Lachnospiraceae bacterium]